VIDALAAAASEIPTKPRGAGKAHKRIIERVRTLYRANDLAALLPVGALQSLALPGEGYKQALTAGLLEVFAAKASPAELIEILRTARPPTAASTANCRSGCRADEFLHRGCAGEPGA